MNAKNANRPVAAQAPDQALDYRARVAGLDSLAMWSINGEH